MNKEDAKVGTRIVTVKGNHGEIVGFWANDYWAKLVLDGGRVSSGNIAKLKLESPGWSNPGQILEATLEALARGPGSEVKV